VTGHFFRDRSFPGHFLVKLHPKIQFLGSGFSYIVTFGAPMHQNPALYSNVFSAMVKILGAGFSYIVTFGEHRFLFLCFL